MGMGSQSRVLNDIVFEDGFTLAETAESQGGHIKGMGLPFKDLLGQKKTAGWTVHEAMAREAYDGIEAFHLWNFPENGMGIRADFVKTCPSAADAGMLKDRHSGHGRIEVNQFPFSIHLLVEAW